MLEFLSDEWLAALGESVDAVGAGSDGEAEDGLALGQIVTAVPWLGGGDVRYTIRLGRAGGSGAAGDEAGGRLVKGSVAEADAVLTTTYEDAAAVTRGTKTAAELLSSGAVKVSGAVPRLVAATRLIEQLAVASGRLSRETVVR